jgi:hypothetical protein
MEDPRTIDGEPNEVARRAALAWQAEVDQLIAQWPGVEAMIRNARLTQIADALDPRAIGISPSPELYAAWEASADASICARIEGTLAVLQRLSKAAYLDPA